MSQVLECYLQGILNDATSKDLLLSKLKAICRIVNSPFEYTETCFKGVIPGTHKVCY
jgi:uncharacterized protein with ATP-grasp and redox domains